ncbi:ankyrin repeat domain-containing protein [bacterium]|nr:ankyrin repeat domain-containing protein [bacterium]MBT4552128.1 ankyrin repeat domain-containing protein [bacterium]MBT5988132.1 ankyrin repeat domain-containing protein [bacterium]
MNNKYKIVAKKTEVFPSQNPKPQRKRTEHSYIRSIYDCASTGCVKTLTEIHEEIGAKKFGILVNIRPLGKTMSALHIACVQINPDRAYDTAKFLLEHGANANVKKTDSLDTPLYAAVAKQYSKLILLLLKYQANKSFANKRGKTPYMLALQKKALCTQTEVLKALA